ncbi:hypothetical protein [Mesobacillus jeotgali]|uniref:Uncharacterized protein n=1 Tax=Mesobacillus jeotgali TaxID=129985 RepID=A0ABY9VC30_9BACI|nr:hypothetical protein [Mesobacillus jeotgali]WNF21463.1 hypothetical protein RH061_14815 [Mesobacillus jeotgali]
MKVNKIYLYLNFAGNGGMAMNYSFIDFQRISKALTTSTEALRNEIQTDEMQLAELQEAENNLRQALSFGLSTPK